MDQPVHLSPSARSNLSWSVALEAVLSLHKAEYRMGDFLANSTETAKGVLANMRKPSHHDDDSGEGEDDEGQMGEKSANLGMVAIELQVGSVKKRTQPFRVMGERRVKVDQQLLMPAPDTGHSMSVRVWRVGHLQKDSLVGEATVDNTIGEALGCRGKVDLHRTGKKKCKGQVELTITAQDIDCRPVFEPGEPEAEARSLSDDVAGAARALRNRIKDVVHKGSSRDLPNPGARQPLLPPTPEDAPAASIGKCKVAVQSIRGLYPRVQDPYFILCVGAQTIQADNLQHRSQVELTFEFDVSDLQGNLCIYCCDQLAADRTMPVGRILLPLADVVWNSGMAPSCASFRRLACAPPHFQQEYTAHFMPLGAASQGEGRALTYAFSDSRFWPALRKQGGSGMKRSLVFGSVTLQLDLTFNKKIAPVLRCQAASFASKATQSRSAPPKQENQVEATADSEAEPTVLSVMRNVDLKMIMRNISRLEAMAIRSRTGGIVRWLRAAWWHGWVASCVWLLICIFGIFPPPYWAWPIFIWFMILLNGLLSAQHQQLQWADLHEPPFLVWNEDTEPEPAGMKEKLRIFSRGLHELMNATGTLASFMERICNMFSFVDTPVTVVYAFGSGIVALSLSTLWYLLLLFDSRGHYTWAIAGVVACFTISRTGPPPRAPIRSQSMRITAKVDQMFQPLATVMAPMKKFNTLFRDVPDQLEVAHRYIATRIQCKTSCKHMDESKALLRVCIQSAKGLRVADWRPLGYGSSDPYCTCEILGIPTSMIKTPIIKKTLEPVWKYSAEISHYSVGDSLEFRVYDFDMGKSDDLLGRVTLKSREFYPSGFEGDLVLLEAGSGVSATLNVKIEVIREMISDAKIDVLREPTSDPRSNPELVSEAGPAEPAQLGEPLMLTEPNEPPQALEQFLAMSD